MARAPSLRRRLTRFINRFSPDREQKRHRFARLFPRFLPLTDWQSGPIVAGLVRTLRTSLYGNRSGSLALGGGLSTRLSPRVEQLEDRRLLSVSWVDDPGDLSIAADYAGDWYVQTDQGTPDVLDAGDIVTWQKDVVGKEQADLTWGINAYGAIQDAIDTPSTTEINVADGTYTASLGIMNRSLSIIGDSAATTIVEDGGFDGITVIGGASDITDISGLTITQSLTAVNVMGATVSMTD